MDPGRLPANVSTLKSAVPTPMANGERRANKRYASDQVTLTFLGVDHAALNWSLGGFLVADRHPHMATGEKIEGVLTVRGYSGRFPFAAEFLRRDARTKEIAFKFLKPSQALVEALRRIIENKA